MKLIYIYIQRFRNIERQEINLSDKFSVNLDGSALRIVRKEPNAAMDYMYGNSFMRDLQDDDYFSELLHYCNILYEMLPTILMASHLRTEKDARKLAAISMVAAGYAGDMDDELANELLDDIDYHFNKVKCRKIEMMMPRLMKIVESEMEGMKNV